MISHVLLAALLAAPSASSAPAGNPSQARKALAACMNSGIKAELDSKTEPPAFKGKLDGMCANEKAAYKAASIAADLAGGIKRAAAEQNASMDIDDVIASTADRYEEFYTSHTAPR